MADAHTCPADPADAASVAVAAEVKREPAGGARGAASPHAQHADADEDALVAASLHGVSGAVLNEEGSACAAGGQVAGGRVAP